MSRTTLRPSGCLDRAPLTLGVALLLFSGTAACGDGPRTDFHGDPLPPGAVARLGTVRLRHSHVDGLIFSKDGERLTSFSSDEKAVRVWDAASGKLVERKSVAEVPDWVHLLDSPKRQGFRCTWAIAQTPDTRRPT